ncbi:MAG: peroxidase-related enzyme [Gammaproteobacteria bacterium]|nr:peroxidase-related enzyme [Gammaproteobacteria bacterium]
MTRTSPAVTDNSLTTLHEINRTFGYVPNLFRTYAKHPPLLEANWNKVKQVLLKGRLERFTKEIIALLVSLDNGCAYCVAAHSAALRGMGMDDCQLGEIIKGKLEDHLSERDVALVNFARKANRLTHDISSDDFSKLISLGCDEAEIVEALGVMELFAGFNRFTRAMGIELDF